MLDIMKSIASLEVDFAVGLLERLKKESIPFEIHPVTQDSGLKYSDIMVADDYYERACDAAEAWEAERLAEAERRANRFCPRCGSAHLQYVVADTFGIGSIWKCKDCGNDFAK
jgi:Zn finger protein HypA/HybF involved in hydrogenase expression